MSRTIGMASFTRGQSNILYPRRRVCVGNRSGLPFYSATSVHAAGDLMTQFQYMLNADAMDLSVRFANMVRDTKAHEQLTDGTTALGNNTIKAGFWMPVPCLLDGSRLLTITALDAANPVTILTVDNSLVSWQTNQFITSGGGIDRHYHVFMTSGATLVACKRISANTANTITISADGSWSTGGALPLVADTFYICKFVPLTFEGGNALTLQPGTWGETRPAAGVFPKATPFWLRYWVPSGGAYPQGAGQAALLDQSVSTDRTGWDATISANVVTDRTSTGIAIGGFHCGVWGIPLTGTGRSTLILGDSLDQGSGDSFVAARGAWARAFDGNNICYFNGGVSGEAIAQVFPRSGIDRISSFRAHIMSSECDQVMCGYGRNDLNGSRTLAQMQADIARLAVMVKARGLRFGLRTITPQTTSSDAWATLNNQTIADATIEAVRVSLNTWIRTLPSGTGWNTDWVEDWAAVAESGSTGKWSVTGGANTGDGIHGNSVGYTAIGAAINLANYQ